MTQFNLFSIDSRSERLARVLWAHLVQNSAHCSSDRARPDAAVRVRAAHFPDREAGRGAEEGE